MNSQSNKRTVFILAGLTDAILGGVALLLYFGFLPLDISGWDIPPWVFGLGGALLFFSGIGMLTFQLTRTDHPD
jgi:protein-S-isoprenylcysteine O-methyltransferase Ste14